MFHCVSGLHGATRRGASAFKIVQDKVALTFSWPWEQATHGLNRLLTNDDYDYFT